MICLYYQSFVLFVRCLARGVKQRMDGNKNTKNDFYNYQKKIRQMDRRTRYILHERDNGKGRRKIIEFDERYMQDQSSSTLIEDMLDARDMHLALDRALSELTSEEDQIITECFFEGEKVNYTKLAQKHGISRQVYCRKRKRILQKLKKSVISHYNIISNLYKMTIF